MTTKSSIVTYTDAVGSTVDIQPGDILWRSSELICDYGTNVRDNSLVITVMFIGRPPFSNKLIFSTISVMDASLERNDHKYVIEISKNKKRIAMNIGVIRKVISKMRDTQDTYILMNKSPSRQYIVKQELFATSLTKMGNMVFVKSGLRLQDMKEWPRHSLHWWAKHVLSLPASIIPKDAPNESLVMAVRCATASRDSKANKIQRNNRPKFKKVPATITRLGQNASGEPGVIRQVRDDTHIENRDSAENAEDGEVQEQGGRAVPTFSMLEDIHFGNEDSAENAEDGEVQEQGGRAVPTFSMLVFNRNKNINIRAEYTPSTGILSIVDPVDTFRSLGVAPTFHIAKHMDTTQVASVLAEI